MWRSGFNVISLGSPLAVLRRTDATLGLEKNDLAAQLFGGASESSR
jgi:hypothetical protein